MIWHNQNAEKYDVLKKNNVPIIIKIYDAKEDANKTNVFHLNLRLEIAPVMNIIFLLNKKAHLSLLTRWAFF